MSKTNDLIRESMRRADERVCFSVSDKMTKKGMSFNSAFEKTIKTLRKGMIENRKESVRSMALEMCKEDCEMWGIEFKLK